MIILSKRRRGNDVRDSRVTPRPPKRRRKQLEQPEEFDPLQMCPTNVQEKIFNAGERMSAIELFNLGNMCTAFVGPIRSWHNLRKIKSCPLLK